MRDNDVEKYTQEMIKKDNEIFTIKKDLLAKEEHIEKLKMKIGVLKAS